MRLRAISLSILAGMFLGILALSACQASGESGVSGTLWLCGGPSPGNCHRQDGRVEVYRGNRLVISGPTRRTHFRFRLPAGRYTLVGRSGGARGRKVVRIAPHVTLRVRLVVPIH